MTSPARNFGQTERLTIRLRQLIRNYTRGLGILKEFVQNADDAGATRLDVWIDWRTHPTGRMPNPQMSIFGGPALLIANDSEFTPDDLQAIQRIGESSKVGSGPKTGRFGLGFNTAYNVTDHPSFVTGGDIYCMDPHASAVTERDHGASWSLQAMWEACPDWPTLFTVAGLVPGAAHHPGTIFRLPLRDEARAAVSEITSKPFTREDIEQILDQASRHGAALLLFSRHLLRLTITEITREGTHTRLIVNTLNPDEVLAGRRPALAALAGDFRKNLRHWKAAPAAMPPLAVWRQLFEIATDTETPRRETWQIAAGLVPGAADRLLDLALRMEEHEEKAIPWVGAAALLDASHPPRARPVEGALHCTLSLPSAVALPVHINGYFDLDDSRQRLTTEAKDAGATQQLRGAWNRALLMEGCARAWIALLRALVPDDLAGLDDLWPDPAESHDPLVTALITGFYDLARAEPLIRVRQSGRLRRAASADLSILPVTASQALQEALLADGFALPDPPMPQHMRRGLAPREFGPADLRQALRETPTFDGPIQEAPRLSLRRPDWIEAMLEFCWSDGEEDLADLPLAMTTADTLRAFGPRANTWIFLPTGDTQALLPSLRSVFLAPSLAKHLTPVPAVKLFAMLPDHVAGLLKYVVGEVARDWQPDAHDPPNSPWLARVFHYFAKHELKEVTLATLRKRALFPGHDGRLHPAAELPPVLVASGTAPVVLRRLRALGVVTIVAPPAVEDALHALLHRHAGLAARVTGATVIEALSARSEALDGLEREAAIDLLEWLSRVELAPPDLERLKRLPLLPTAAGLRRACDGGVFLPAGFHVPQLGTTIDLVDVPPSCTHLVLRLGVEALEAPKFIERQLIPALPSVAPDDRARAWRWLRDELAAILARMDPAAAKKLRRIVADAPAFPATDGTLRPVSSMYDPGSQLVRDVLGDHALYPEPAIIREGNQRWHDLLVHLDIAQAPKIRDLVNHLFGLCKKGLAEAEAIRRIFDYLHGNWDAVAEVTFRTAQQQLSLRQLLQQQAWLPPVLQGSSPGFVSPEPRLYRPQELYTELELVGSQAPVCAWDVPAKMADAIGLRRVPPPSLVLAHFEHLLDDDAPAADHAGALDRHAKALPPIYRYLARCMSEKRSNGPSAFTRDDLETLERLRDRPCLWDLGRRRLWRPDHVFVEAVPYLEPLRTSLTTKIADEVVLLLGGKRRPEADDYRDFLHDLAGNLGGEVVPLSQRWQVSYALRHVDGGSHLDELPLPCIDGRLRLSSTMFVDDAPWLVDRPDDLHYVHAEVPISLLSALDVPRVSEALSEELHSVEERDVALEVRRACATLQARLRAPGFVSGVHRLVRHGHGPAAEPALGAITGLRLEPVAQLRTNLVLRGKEITSVEARYFFRTTDQTLMLTGHPEHRLVPYVARTIQRLLGPDFQLVDTAPLEHILLCEPGSVHDVLNDDRITHVRYEERIDEPEPPAFVQIHAANRGEDPDDDDADEAETPPDADEAETPPNANRHAGHAGQVHGADGSDHEPDAPTTPATSPAAPWGNAPGGGTDRHAWSTALGGSAGAAASPNGQKIGGAAYSPGAWASNAGLQAGLMRVANALESPPPQSTANAADEGTPLSIPRHDARPQGLQPGLHTRDAHDEASEEQARQTEDQALQLIMADECVAGRDPERLPKDHPGYNIRSKDRATGEVLRLIEVKGTQRDWREHPVRMTVTQLQASLQHPGQYWLYIVERLAGTPRVHRIPAPAAHIVGFSLDAAGWARLAEGAPAPTEPREGLEVWISDGLLGTIRAVRRQSALILLDIERPDGTLVKKPYRPSEHRLKEARDGEDGP
jgi:hypothetical protein